MECKDGAEPGGGEFSASMDSSAKEHLIMKGIRLALDAASLQWLGLSNELIINAVASISMCNIPYVAFLFVKVMHD